MYLFIKDFYTTVLIKLIFTETKSTYVENPEFEPLPMKDLIDPTMAFWVHHTQHILKQGRTKWWSSQPPKGEEV